MKLIIVIRGNSSFVKAETSKIIQKRRNVSGAFWRFAICSFDQRPSPNVRNKANPSTKISC